MSFAYNSDGLRVTKTVNGVVTTYYYQGSLLIAEETNSQILVYLYDTNGAPIGFKYRDSSYTSGTWDTYVYEKNIQGDIIGVYDALTGIKHITYAYDAWGIFTSYYLNNDYSTTAGKNPFMYRGYYYDSDLNMYYLQSRYYDPNICRFINADGYISTGQGLTGYNMFAYCGNNPVMRADPKGEGWILAIALIVVLAVSLTSCSSTEVTEEDINLYSNQEGAPQEGKINVKFTPDSENPSFQIENTYLINDYKQREYILKYIMNSEFYDQDVYGRSLDSMMIEWDMHNRLYRIYPIDRLAHTDFDKESEDWSRSDYIIFAIQEALK